MKIRNIAIAVAAAFGASLLTSCTFYNTEVYNPPPRRTTSTYTKAPVGGVSSTYAPEGFQAVERPASYSY